MSQKTQDVDFVGPCRNRLNSWSTPDYRELKKRNDIAVMFCDSFRPGGMFNSLIEGMPYLGEGITVTEWFQQREIDNYDDPMFVKFEKRPPPSVGPTGKIVGDVFVLDPLKILEVDRFMQNTKMFIRSQHWVWMIDQKSPFKDRSKASLKVWMYLANPDVFRTNPYKTPKPQAKTKSDVPLYDFDAHTQSYLNRIGVCH